MRSLFILEISVEEITALLNTVKGIKPSYEVKEYLTYADAKQLISKDKPAGTHVRALTFKGAITYPMWFGIAITAGGSEHADINFASDMLLIHGAHKEDPWALLTFKCLPASTSTTLPFPF